MSDKAPLTPPIDEGAKIIADMSPEELELNKNRFLFKQGFITEDPDTKKEATPPKETPAPAAANPKEEAAKEEAKPDAEKPAEEKPKAAPKTRAQKPRVGLTTDEVQSAVQAGALAAIEATRPAPVQERPAAEEVQLSDKDRHTIEALRMMETENPKFKGVADQTVAFWKKESKYIEDWEASNPGKKFDDQSDDHQEFYERHQPDVDADALDRAKLKVATQPMVKVAEEATKVANEAKETTRRIQFERNFDKAVPEMEQAIESGLLEVVEKSNPELAKLMGDKGKRRWSEESMKKIEEEDPVAFDLIQSEAEKARQLLADFECLTRFPGDIPFDPSRAVELSDGTDYYPHRELVKLISDLESDLAALPREDTERNGKQFIPQPKLVEREARIHAAANMTADQKKAAIRELRGNFWTLSQDEIRAGIVAETAGKVTARMEKTQALFNRKASKSKPAEGKPTPEPKKEIEHEKPAPAPRMAAPSVTASSDKLNNNGAGSGSGQSIGDMAVSRTFGG